MASYLPPRRLLAALLTVVALFAAACGGDGEPELDGTSAETDTGGTETDTDGSAASDPADDATTDSSADGDAGSDDIGDDDQPVVGGGADIAFPTPAPPTGEPSITSASKLTTVGLGDVFFGDTVRAIRSKVPGPWVGLPAADARPSCFTMQPAGGPEGTVFMILDGRVERIDLASPEITTRSGIGVGSTTEDIVELFESNIETTAIAGGEEIVFIPTDEVDRDFRIVWTTDGTTVTAMRAGRMPGVLAASPCG